MKMTIVTASIGLMMWVFAHVFMILRQESFLFHPETLAADHEFTFTEKFEVKKIAVPGAELDALYFRVPEAKGLVVYYHGNAGSLRNWGALGATFAARGYELLIYDYRGFGRSTGSIASEEEFLADAEAVFQAALRLQSDLSRIVIYGRSMGSGVAAWVARDREVKALILETPYDSMESLVREKVPFFMWTGLLRYTLRSREFVKHLKTRVLIVHGTDDFVIPISQGARLAKGLGDRAEFVVIDGGEHSNLSQFETYQKTLTNWLQ